MFRLPLPASVGKAGVTLAAADAARHLEASGWQLWQCAGRHRSEVRELNRPDRFHGTGAD